MMQDRLNAQMWAAKQEQDRLAALHPPVTTTGDLDASRAVNEQLNAVWTQGGPEMVETIETHILVNGRRVRCRMHRPTASATLPVLVWCHGGGWVFASIDSHDRLAREYAAAAGIAVFLVDYALAPEAKFPQGLLECAGAVRILARDAVSWGIDPARITIGGDSAGSNLALAAALLLRDTAGPALRGVLALYPVTDSSCDTPSYHAFADGFGLTRASMREYWRLYTRDPVDLLHPLAAPLLARMEGLPPCLIQLAEIDVLRDDGILIAERMRAEGVDVSIETIPGVLHGFMRLSGVVDAAAQAIARAGAWLARVSA